MSCASTTTPGGATSDELCRLHGIPVTRENVLTHAEVQSTLGIAQRAKWDVKWLPGMPTAVDAHEIGDTLRERVATSLATTARHAPFADPDAPETGFWARIFQWLTSLIKG